jgi:predicted O-methyltransferase YrrM
MVSQVIYYNKFPIMADWQAAVLKEGDLPQYRRADFYEYYKTKFEICREIRPQRICEIGVRYGYSAFSFLLAAPRASYIGYDIIAGTHGGARGIDTFDYAGYMLGRHFPIAQISLVHADTRLLDKLACGPFDFIHIDGDHSVEGCRHDLDLALSACRPGGTILVDDYNYIAGVTAAADKFYETNRNYFSSRQSRRSLRGELILMKGEIYDKAQTVH